MIMSVLTDTPLPAMLRRAKQQVIPARLAVEGYYLGTLYMIRLLIAYQTVLEAIGKVHVWRILT